MEQHVTIHETYPLQCQSCRGMCYVPKNPSATQAKVRTLFGMPIPQCIDGTNGQIFCPFHKGKA